MHLKDSTKIFLSVATALYKKLPQKNTTENIISKSVKILRKKQKKTLIL